jgi:hypothetical protein
MKNSFDYFDEHPSSANRNVEMTKEEYEEYRMWVIMRNGNSGEHYDQLDLKDSQIRKLDTNFRAEPWDDGEYDETQ